MSIINKRLSSVLRWSKERAKDMDHSLPSSCTLSRLESNPRAFGDGYRSNSVVCLEYPPFDFPGGVNFSIPPEGVRNDNKAPTPTAECKKGVIRCKKAKRGICLDPHGSEAKNIDNEHT